MMVVCAALRRKYYESHENAWEKVSLQTSWRLEPCTKPVDEFDVTIHMPNYSHENVDDTVKLTTHDIVKASSSPKTFNSNESTKLSTCNSYTLLVLTTSNVGEIDTSISLSVPNVNMNETKKQ